MKKLLIIVLLLSLAACTPASSTAQQTPTTTQVLVTATPSSTPTVTSTATPKPTATPLPLTEAERDLILQAYKVMLFIQLDANLLNETALKVQTGELDGFEALGALFVVGALVNAIDEAIPQTTPPEVFSPFWDQAFPIHNATKNLVAKWVNQDIDSNAVIEAITPLLPKIDKILTNLEKKLASEIGVSAGELKKAREEAVQSLSEVLGTPTPSP